MTKGGKRIVNLLLRGQRHAELVPRLGVIRLVANRFAEAFGSLIEVGRGHQDGSQLKMSLGIAGPNAQAFAERVDGLVKLAAVFQGVGKVLVIEDAERIGLDSAADKLRRRVEPAGLRRHHAAHVQGVGMTGRMSEDFPADSLGLVEATGAVMPAGGLELVLDRQIGAVPAKLRYRTAAAG